MISSSVCPCPRLKFLASKEFLPPAVWQVRRESALEIVKLLHIDASKNVLDSNLNEYQFEKRLIQIYDGILKAKKRH